MNPKYKIKLITGIVFLLLVVVGASASFFLSQQNQDIRQQADDSVGAYNCDGVWDGNSCVPTNSSEKCTEEGFRWIEDEQRCRRVDSDRNSERETENLVGREPNSEELEEGIIETSFDGIRPTNEGSCGSVWMNSFCYMPGDEFEGGLVVVESGRHDYPYFEKKEVLEGISYGAESVSSGKIGTSSSLGSDCGGKGLDIDGICYAYGSNVNGYLVMPDGSGLKEIETRYEDWEKAVSEYENSGDLSALEALYQNTYGISFSEGNLYDSSAVNADVLRAESLLLALTNSDVLQAEAKKDNEALKKELEERGDLSEEDRERKQAEIDFNQKLIDDPNLNTRYQTLDWVTSSTVKSTTLNRSYNEFVEALGQARDEDLEKVAEEKFQKIFGYDPSKKYGDYKGILKALNIDPKHIEETRDIYKHNEAVEAQLSEQEAILERIESLSYDLIDEDDKNRLAELENALASYSAGRISSTDLGLVLMSGDVESTRYLGGMSEEDILTSVYRNLGIEKTIANNKATEVVSFRKNNIALQGYLGSGDIKYLQESVYSDTRLKYSRNDSLSKDPEDLLKTMFGNDDGERIYKDHVLPTLFGPLVNLTGVISEQDQYYIDKVIPLQNYLRTGDVGDLREAIFEDGEPKGNMGSAYSDPEALLKILYGKDEGARVYQETVLPKLLDDALANFSKNPNELGDLCSKTMGEDCLLDQEYSGFGKINRADTIEDLLTKVYGKNSGRNIHEEAVLISGQLLHDSNEAVHDTNKKEAINLALSIGGASSGMSLNLMPEESGKNQADRELQLAIQASNTFNAQDTFEYSSREGVRGDVSDYIHGTAMGDAFMYDNIFDRRYDLQDDLGLGALDSVAMGWNQVITQGFGVQNTTENIATNYAKIMQQGYVGPANTLLADIALQSAQNLGGSYSKALDLDYQAANSGHYLRQGFGVSDELMAEEYGIDKDDYITFQTDDEIVRSKKELNWEVVEKVVAPIAGVVALPVAVTVGAPLTTGMALVSSSFSLMQAAEQRARAFELDRTTILRDVNDFRDGENVAARALTEVSDLTYGEALEEIETQSAGLKTQSNVMLASSLVSGITGTTGLATSLMGTTNAITNVTTMAGRVGGLGLGSYTAYSSGSQAVSAYKEVASIKEELALGEKTGLERLNLLEQKKQLLASGHSGVATSFISALGVLGNGFSFAKNPTTLITGTDLWADSLSLPIGVGVDMYNVSQSCSGVNGPVDEKACDNAWIGLAIGVIQDTTQIINSRNASISLRNSKSAEYIQKVGLYDVEITRLYDLGENIDSVQLKNLDYLLVSRDREVASALDFNPKLKSEFDNLTVVISRIGDVNTQDILKLAKTEFKGDSTSLAKQKKAVETYDQIKKIDDQLLEKLVGLDPSKAQTKLAQDEVEFLQIQRNKLTQELKNLVEFPAIKVSGLRDQNKQMLALAEANVVTRLYEQSKVVVGAGIGDDTGANDAKKKVVVGEGDGEPDVKKVVDESDDKADFEKAISDAKEENPNSPKTGIGSVWSKVTAAVGGVFQKRTSSKVADKTESNNLNKTEFDSSKLASSKDAYDDLVQTKKVLDDLDIEIEKVKNQSETDSLKARLAELEDQRNGIIGAFKKQEAKILKPILSVETVEKIASQDIQNQKALIEEIRTQRLSEIDSLDLTKPQEKLVKDLLDIRSKVFNTDSSKRPKDDDLVQEHQNFSKTLDELNKSILGESPKIEAYQKLGEAQLFLKEFSAFDAVNKVIAGHEKEPNSSNIQKIKDILSSRESSITAVSSDDLLATRLEIIIRDAEFKSGVSEGVPLFNTTNQQSSAILKHLVHERVATEVNTGGGKTFVGAVVLDAKIELFGKTAGLALARDGQEADIQEAMAKSSGVSIDDVVIVDSTKLSDQDYVDSLLGAKKMVSNLHNVLSIRNYANDYEGPNKARVQAVYKKLTTNLGISIDEVQMLVNPNKSSIISKGESTEKISDIDKTSGHSVGKAIEQELMAGKKWGLGEYEFLKTKTENDADISDFKTKYLDKIFTNLAGQIGVDSAVYKKLANNPDLLRSLEATRVFDGDDGLKVHLAKENINLTSEQVVKLLHQVDMISVYAQSFKVPADTGFKRMVDSVLAENGGVKRAITIPASEGQASLGQSFSQKQQVAFEYIGAKSVGEDPTYDGLTASPNKSFKSNMTDFIGDLENCSVGAMTGAFANSRGVIETSYGMVTYRDSEAVDRVFGRATSSAGGEINANNSWQVNGENIADAAIEFFRDGLLETSAEKSSKGNARMTLGADAIESVSNFASTMVAKAKKRFDFSNKQFILQEDSGKGYYLAKISSDGEIIRLEENLSTKDAQRMYQDDPENLILIIGRAGSTGDSIATGDHIPGISFIGFKDPEGQGAQTVARINRIMGEKANQYGVIINNKVPKIDVSKTKNTDFLSKTKMNLEQFIKFRKSISVAQVDAEKALTTQSLNQGAESAGTSVLSYLARNAKSQEVRAWASKKLLEITNSPAAKNFDLVSGDAESIEVRRKKIANLGAEWEKIMSDEKNQSFLKTIEEDENVSFLRIQANASVDATKLKYAKTNPTGNKEAVVTARTLPEFVENHGRYVTADSESKYIADSGNPPKIEQIASVGQSRSVDGGEAAARVSKTVTDVKEVTSMAVDMGTTMSWRALVRLAKEGINFRGIGNRLLTFVSDLRVQQRDEIRSQQQETDLQENLTDDEDSLGSEIASTVGRWQELFGKEVVLSEPEGFLADETNQETKLEKAVDTKDEVADDKEQVIIEKTEAEAEIAAIIEKLGIVEDVSEVKEEEEELIFEKHEFLETDDLQEIFSIVIEEARAINKKVGFKQGSEENNLWFVFDPNDNSLVPVGNKPRLSSLIREEFEEALLEEREEKMRLISLQEQKIIAADIIAKREFIIIEFGISDPAEIENLETFTSIEELNLYLEAVTFNRIQELEEKMTEIEGNPGPDKTAAFTSLRALDKEVDRLEENLAKELLSNNEESSAAVIEVEDIFETARTVASNLRSLSFGASVSAVYRKGVTSLISLSEQIIAFVDELRTGQEEIEQVIEVGELFTNEPEVGLAEASEEEIEEEKEAIIADFKIKDSVSLEILAGLTTTEELEIFEAEILKIYEVLEERFKSIGSFKKIKNNEDLRIGYKEIVPLELVYAEGLNNPEIKLEDEKKEYASISRKLASFLDKNLQSLRLGVLQEYLEDASEELEILQGMDFESMGETDYLLQQMTLVVKDFSKLESEKRILFLEAADLLVLETNKKNLERMPISELENFLNTRRQEILYHSATEVESEEFFEYIEGQTIIDEIKKRIIDRGTVFTISARGVRISIDKDSSVEQVESLLDDFINKQYRKSLGKAWGKKAVEFEKLRADLLKLNFSERSLLAKYIRPDGSPLVEFDVKNEQSFFYQFDVDKVDQITNSEERDEVKKLSQLIDKIEEWFTNNEGSKEDEKQISFVEAGSSEESVNGNKFSLSAIKEFFLNLLPSKKPPIHITQSYLNKLKLEEASIESTHARVTFVKNDPRLAVKFARENESDKELLDDEAKIISYFSEKPGGELLPEYYGTMESSDEQNYVMERIRGADITTIGDMVEITEEAILVALKRYENLLKAGFDYADTFSGFPRNIIVMESGEIRLIDSTKMVSVVEIDDLIEGKVAGFSPKDIKGKMRLFRESLDNLRSRQEEAVEVEESKEDKRRKKYIEAITISDKGLSREQYLQLYEKQLNELVNLNQKIAEKEEEEVYSSGDNRAALGLISLEADFSEIKESLDEARAINKAARFIALDIPIIFTSIFNKTRYLQHPLLVSAFMKERSLIRYYERDSLKLKEASSLMAKKQEQIKTDDKNGYNDLDSLAREIVSLRESLSVDHYDLPILVKAKRFVFSDAPRFIKNLPNLLSRNESESKSDRGGVNEDGEIFEVPAVKEATIVSSFSIGRQDGNDIRLNNDVVSRKHAEINLLSNGNFSIKDLGSKNGLWVQVDGVWMWEKVDYYEFERGINQVAFNNPKEIGNHAEVMRINIDERGYLSVLPDIEYPPSLEIRPNGSVYNLAQLRIEHSKKNSSVAEDMGTKYIDKEKSERQQDSAQTYANPNPVNQKIGKLLMATVDGMGGYGDGGKASRFIQSRVSEIYFNERTETDITKRLKNTLVQLHEELSKQGFADAAGVVMDLSVITEDKDGEKIHVAHIGDTQTWVIRNGELRKLTHDQTVVQAMVDSGKITEQEARRHSKRNSVNNAIAVGGRFSNAAIEVRSYRLEPGDIVVSFSDGVVDPLEYYGKLEQTLRVIKQSSSPEETAKEIKDTALNNAKEEEKEYLAARGKKRKSNEVGTIDNISVVVYKSSVFEIKENILIETYDNLASSLRKISFGIYDPQGWLSALKNLWSSINDQNLYSVHPSMRRLLEGSFDESLVSTRELGIDEIALEVLLIQLTDDIDFSSLPLSSLKEYIGRINRLALGVNEEEFDKSTVDSFSKAKQSLYAAQGRHEALLSEVENLASRLNLDIKFSSTISGLSEQKEMMKDYQKELGSEVIATSEIVNGKGKVFGREDLGEFASLTSKVDKISRDHFLIGSTNGEIFIKDISSNGTYVDGERIGKDKWFKLTSISNRITVGDGSVAFYVHVVEEDGVHSIQLQNDINQSGVYLYQSKYSRKINEIAGRDISLANEATKILDLISEKINSKQEVLSLIEDALKKLDININTQVGTISINGQLLDDDSNLKSGDLVTTKKVGDDGRIKFQATYLVEVLGNGINLSTIHIKDSGNEVPAQNIYSPIKNSDNLSISLSEEGHVVGIRDNKSQPSVQVGAGIMTEKGERRKIHPGSVVVVRREEETLTFVAKFNEDGVLDLELTSDDAEIVKEVVLEEVKVDKDNKTEDNVDLDKAKQDLIAKSLRNDIERLHQEDLDEEQGILEKFKISVLGFAEFHGVLSEFLYKDKLDSIVSQFISDLEKDNLSIVILVSDASGIDELIAILGTEDFKTNFMTLSLKSRAKVIELIDGLTKKIPVEIATFNKIVELKEAKEKLIQREFEERRLLVAAQLDEAVNAIIAKLTVVSSDFYKAHMEDNAEEQRKIIENSVEKVTEDQLKASGLGRNEFIEMIKGELEEELLADKKEYDKITPAERIIEEQATAFTDDVEEILKTTLAYVLENWSRLNTDKLIAQDGLGLTEENRLIIREMVNEKIISDYKFDLEASKISALVDELIAVKIIKEFPTKFDDHIYNTLSSKKHYKLDEIRWSLAEADVLSDQRDANHAVIKTAQILDASEIKNWGKDSSGEFARKYSIGEFAKYLKYDRALAQKQAKSYDDGDDVLTLLHLGDGVYTVIQGTHRVMAAKFAGTEELEVVVVELELPKGEVAGKYLDIDQQRILRNARGHIRTLENTSDEKELEIFDHSFFQETIIDRKLSEIVAEIDEGSSSLALIHPSILNRAFSEITALLEADITNEELISEITRAINKLPYEVDPIAESEIQDIVINNSEFSYADYEGNRVEAITNIRKEIIKKLTEKGYNAENYLNKLASENSLSIDEMIENLLKGAVSKDTVEENGEWTREYVQFDQEALASGADLIGFQNTLVESTFDIEARVVVAQMTEWLEDNGFESGAVLGYLSSVHGEDFLTYEAMPTMTAIQNNISEEYQAFQAMVLDAENFGDGYFVQGVELAMNEIEDAAGVLGQEIAILEEELEIIEEQKADSGVKKILETVEDSIVDLLSILTAPAQLAYKGKLTELVTKFKTSLEEVGSEVLFEFVKKTMIETDMKSLIKVLESEEFKKLLVSLPDENRSKVLGLIDELTKDIPAKVSLLDEKIRLEKAAADLQKEQANLEREINQRIIDNSFNYALKNWKELNLEDLTLDAGSNELTHENQKIIEKIVSDQIKNEFGTDPTSDQIAFFAKDILAKFTARFAREVHEKLYFANHKHFNLEREVYVSLSDFKSSKTEAKEVNTSDILDAVNISYSSWGKEKDKLYTDKVPAVGREGISAFAKKLNHNADKAEEEARQFVENGEGDPIQLIHLGGGVYHAIGGTHRIIAAKFAGVKKLNVVVRELYFPDGKSFEDYLNAPQMDTLNIARDYVFELKMKEKLGDLGEQKPFDYEFEGRTTIEKQLNELIADIAEGRSDLNLIHPSTLTETFNRIKDLLGQELGNKDLVLRIKKELEQLASNNRPVAAEEVDTIIKNERYGKPDYFTNFNSYKNNSISSVRFELTKMLVFKGYNAEKYLDLLVENNRELRNVDHLIETLLAGKNGQNLASKRVSMYVQPSREDDVLGVRVTTIQGELVGMINKWNWERKNRSTFEFEFKRALEFWLDKKGLVTEDVMSYLAQTRGVSKQQLLEKMSFKWDFSTGETNNSGVVFTESVMGDLGTLLAKIRNDITEGEGAKKSSAVSLEDYFEQGNKLVKKNIEDEVANRYDLDFRPLEETAQEAVLTPIDKFRELSGHLGKVKGVSWEESCSSCSDVRDQAKEGLEIVDDLIATAQIKFDQATTARNEAKSTEGKDKAKELETKAKNLEKDAEKLKQQALAQINKTRKEVINSHGMQNQCVQLYLNAWADTREALIRNNKEYTNKAIDSVYRATVIAESLLSSGIMNVVEKQGFFGFGKKILEVKLEDGDLTDIRNILEGNDDVKGLKQMADFRLDGEGKRVIVSGDLYYLQKSFPGIKEPLGIKNLPVVEEKSFGIKNLPIIWWQNFINGFRQRFYKAKEAEVIEVVEEEDLPVEEKGESAVENNENRMVDPRDFFSSTVFQKEAGLIDVDESHNWESVIRNDVLATDKVGRVAAGITYQHRLGQDLGLLIAEQTKDGKSSSMYTGNLSPKSALLVVNRIPSVIPYLSGELKHQYIQYLIATIPILKDASDYEVSKSLSFLSLNLLPDHPRAAQVSDEEISSLWEGQAISDEQKQQLISFVGLVSKKLSDDQFRDYLSQLSADIKKIDDPFGTNYSSLFFQIEDHVLKTRKDIFFNPDILERPEVAKYPVVEMIQRDIESVEQLEEILSAMLAEEIPNTVSLERGREQAEMVDLSLVVGGNAIDTGDWTISTSTSRGTEKIYEMVESFKDGSLGVQDSSQPITMEEFEGKYYVTEGRHRVAALKALEVKEIPVMVAHVKSISEVVEETEIDVENSVGVEAKEEKPSPLETITDFYIKYLPPDKYSQYYVFDRLGNKIPFVGNRPLDFMSDLIKNVVEEVGLIELKFSEELANTIIEWTFPHLVLSNLDKFEGIDQVAMVTKILEVPEGMSIILPLVDKLDDSGQQEVVNRLSENKHLSEEIMRHLPKDSNIFSLVVENYLPLFKKDKHREIFEVILESGRMGLPSLIKNLDKFHGLEEEDYNLLINKLFEYELERLIPRYVLQYIESDQGPIFQRLISKNTKTNIEYMLFYMYKFNNLTEINWSEILSEVKNLTEESLILLIDYAKFMDLEDRKLLTSELIRRGTRIELLPELIELEDEQTFLYLSRFSSARLEKLFGDLYDGRYYKALSVLLANVDGIAVNSFAQYKNISWKDSIDDFNHMVDRDNFENARYLLESMKFIFPDKKEAIESLENLLLGLDAFTNRENSSRENFVKLDPLKEIFDYYVSVLLYEKYHLSLETKDFKEISDPIRTLSKKVKEYIVLAVGHELGNSFNKMGIVFSDDRAMSSYKISSDEEIRMFFERAEVSFKNPSNFSTGYGGDSWGIVAHYGEKMWQPSFEDDLKEQIFAMNIIIGIEHNNGTFFDKDRDRVDLNRSALKRLLDFESGANNHTLFSFLEYGRENKIIGDAEYQHYLDLNKKLSEHKVVISGVKVRGGYFITNINRQLASVRSNDSLPSEVKIGVKKHADSIVGLSSEKTGPVLLGRLLNTMKIDWESTEGSEDEVVSRFTNGENTFFLISIEGYKMGFWYKDGELQAISDTRDLEGKYSELSKIFDQQVVKAQSNYLKEGD